MRSKLTNRMIRAAANGGSLNPIMLGRAIAIVAFCFALITAAAAGEPSLPASFKSQSITTTDGAEIFVRTGGSGPVVVLLHGFGDTGDMWGPLAEQLMKTHTVIVPDLRGFGNSSHPAEGYDKRTEAADI